MNLLLEMDPHLNFGLLSKKIKRSKLSCGVFFDYFLTWLVHVLRK